MQSSVTASNLICTQCNILFNLTKREPILLMCCQQTACRSCVENNMIKGQNKTIVVKSHFECSFCHSDHIGPRGFENPMPILPNLYVRQLVE